MKDNPCTKDCEKRNAVCHSVCKEYIDWRKALDEFNEQKVKKKQSEKMLDDYKATVIIKTRRPLK